ncbi:protein neprosin-like [Typha angustifolia]|uniref:protein neprosin-like n=1 Tax=Typha angustifolia TaxID=59011 RepID=UPI003C2B45F4
MHVSASKNLAGNKQIIPTALQMEEIKQYLGKINKPAVKSIKSPDGDIIDCVRIDLQPALDHPLLKNHNIQMVPSMIPTYRGGNYTINTQSVRQGWSDVSSCPSGTVAIRRIKVEEVLRAKSLSRFGKKPLNYRSSASINPTHEYAIAHPNTQNGPIYGTRATFNVWDPDVEVGNEFSLSQLWMSAGLYENSDLNTIEAGWQVYPGSYGDKSTRLFIYWTADSYKNTGCYNLHCPGFVQTNNNIVIGGVLSPVSTYGGSQHEITLLIWKDQSSGNWWLKYGETIVGYWPSELFTHLSSYATSVEWGGEIVNTSPNGVHTSTNMGSGNFAEEGYEKASYIRNLMIVDSSNSLSPLQSIISSATNPNCYDVQNYQDANWGVSFFYGGPGKNSLCT